MKTHLININQFRESTLAAEKQPFDKRYGAYLTKISAERKERIMAFRFEKDRLLSMAAVLLLTDALAIKGTDIRFPLRFAYGQNSKPYLADLPELPFSLSHSGAYAALALADIGECSQIGVDIQEAEDIKCQEIAANFYTEDERRLLLDAPDRKRLFYELWSAKEAFVKCTGEGILRDLTSFTADLSKGSILDCETGRILAKITQQTCPEGYTCCVAYI